MSAGNPERLSGGDGRAHTQTMQRIRQAALSGRRPDAAPRSVIGASWRRVSARGLDPGGGPEIAPLNDADLRHARELSGLRPLLPQLRAHLLPAAESAGQAIVVAQDGAVAAVTGVIVPEHLQRPDNLISGAAWLPALGHVVVEPIGGGWLLRIGQADDLSGERTSLELNLADARPAVHVAGPSGSWSLTPSPRHTELLLALLQQPAGCTAADLADELFADRARTVTVRAEMSRLRRTFGSLLETQPYRVATGVNATVVLPTNRSSLMASSNAPIVTRLRSTTPQLA